MKKIILSLLATAMITTGLMAGGSIAPIDEPLCETVFVETQKDLYIGGSVYGTQLALDGEIDWFSTGFLNNISYGLGVQGGYVFLRNGDFSTAVEGRLGTTFASNGELDQTSAAIFVKPAYDFGVITGYALVGYAWSDFDVDYTDVFSYTVNDSGFAWGVGISGDVTDSVEIFVDYVLNSDIDDVVELPYGDGGVRNGIVSLGVNYKF